MEFLDQFSDEELDLIDDEFIAQLLFSYHHA